MAASDSPGLDGKINVHGLNFLVYSQHKKNVDNTLENFPQKKNIHSSSL